ncbi:acid phosphatase/Vanadium-dependent haloperoxidase [Hyaloscypha bicolor E]|uniref:Acid phosphatase/Vanadium-dependent haloperoxidase n=1 Tax=Hyaloscypha bicolor E TaxID=1095630 RepID=A0A2J6TRZ1_9HELO|nr:acid phosphatase/Vanadium-dependent haloperoxidase [Hyaloscypha bicolor E]PMD65738.1 acid phosphatase/Vanadium-dependent haloperoxidase [Hyaloscypha bicolor E]
MPRSSQSPDGGLAARTGWIGSLARFWQKTYAPDYLGFTLLMVAYFSIQFFVEPFHRMFFINNINILYPHALQERVPVLWNIFYAGVVPFICLVIWLAIARANIHKFHVTILGLLISIFLTTFITDVVKNAVGRPRPDLISRCKPANTTPKDVLVDISVCTETDHHTLHDGWRSFPSGHSSFAFSGLGFLALFFAGQMHVFRPRTDLTRALLTISPLIGAALIAISRCEDYRHDVYDVTCGSILGMSTAYFSYRRYYPRLHSPKCDEPFPSRESSFNEGFAKIKNDEEAVRGPEDFVLSEDEHEH